MIGYTNSTASKPMPGEYINIRLLTNQSSHSDLNGIAFTVEYESHSKDYTWEGSEISILIPADMEYTVKFNEVNGYRTPENVTYTAEAENARDIEALYQCELLTVNVSAYEGEVSGFEVKISENKILSESLSDDYTPLEYIESTGSQYIDTGFKPNQDTRIVVKLTCPVISGATTWALGARLSSSSQMFGFVTSSSGYYRTQYGSVMNDINTSYNTSEPFVLDKNKETTSIDGNIVATASAQTFTCPVNLTLCALNNNGTINYGSIKLYSCKIYDNDILIRDFVPVKNNDSIVGLYDKMNNIFYPSVGTENFVAGPEAIYTPVEYIESTGSQHINTGFKPNQNTKMYLDVAFLSSVGTNVAGVRNSASDTTNRFGIISFGSTSKIGAFFRDSSIQSIAYDTLRHEYELSKLGLVVDGTSYGSANSGIFSCAYPITLGAWNNGGGGISYNNSRIYGCKIYDNGTLVRDYIPTLRSDGIAGLYDAVNDAFYASNGTDSFVAGTKVESVVGVQTTAVETYKIPFGMKYTVSASSVDGYVTPAIQIFMAEESIKNVDIVYITHEGIKNPSIGIYIQDTDGYFHYPENWDGTYIPNGIAVINTSCEFIMALEDAHSSCQWGSYGMRVLSITTAGSRNEANADYDGEAQTTAIINEVAGTNDDHVDGAPASEYCRAYTFPNGKKGYLGAAGEWGAVVNNLSSIESALARCGCDAMSYEYWTSTQYSAYDTWYMDTFNKRLVSSYKFGLRSVRAFCQNR